MHTFENVDRYMKRQFDYISSSNIYIFIWKNTNNLIKANFFNLLCQTDVLYQQQKTFQHMKYLTMAVCLETNEPMTSQLVFSTKVIK